MKCPSCSSETEEARGFCEMCGEPFAKKKAEAEATVAPPKKEPAVKISAEVMTKVLEAAGKVEGPKGPVDIPAEFKGLDTGGQIPQVPEQARKLAWVMLAVIAIWICIAIGWMFMNQDKIASGMK